MLDHEIIVNQFKYNCWATERIISDVTQLTAEQWQQKLAISLATVHQLLEHLYYYDLKVYQRLVLQYSAKPAKHYTADELVRGLVIQAKQWLSWLTESNVELASATTMDLLNLLTHNNYHRGQLAMALAEFGVKPQSLDVYLFKEV